MRNKDTKIRPPGIESGQTISDQHSAFQKIKKNICRHVFMLLWCFIMLLVTHNDPSCNIGNVQAFVPCISTVKQRHKYLLSEFREEIINICRKEKQSH